MSMRQTLPHLWLLSDVRNDGALEGALAHLPRGSGFVFRHYHLPPPEREARFAALAVLARANGHVAILSGEPTLARRWGADGVYGTATAIGPPGELLRLATAHDGPEIAAANAARADGIVLSPVFATRSHPGGATLGPFGFSVLSQQAIVPVIALGGMTPATARQLGWPRWAAIDGLSKY